MEKPVTASSKMAVVGGRNLEAETETVRDRDRVRQRQKESVHWILDP